MVYRFGIFTLFLFCSLHAILLQGQPRFSHFELIDQETGLPDISVRDICKDPDGFIWFATGNGLCRFDGTQFKVFRHDPNDPASIFDNNVLGVQPYRGKIWVATYMGLSVFDPRTEKFSHYQFADFRRSTDTLSRQVGQLVLELYLDPHGDLWIGTQAFGPGRYIPEKDDFEFFPQERTAEYITLYTTNNNMRVLSMAASTANDSIIYVGTPTGLQEVNHVTGTSTWYVFSQATPRMQTHANAFLSLYCHDDGLLYCGSWSAGIHVFDPRDKSYRPLAIAPGKASRIAGAGTRGMTRKNADEFWITTGRGIVLYNPERKEATYWKENDEEFNQYYGISYIDENDRVWMYTIYGVEVFDPCLQQFVAYSYKKLRPPGQSFAFYIEEGPTDDELIVLPRNDNGIYHFNLKTHTYTRYLLKGPGFRQPDNWGVLGFDKAPNGTYTINAENGVFEYDPHTHQLKRSAFSLPIDYYNLRNTHWDPSGFLWMSGVFGVMYRWDPRTGDIRKFQQEFLDPGYSNPQPLIHHAWSDSRKRTWIRREGGYSLYIPERDTMYNFLEEVNPENSFTQVGSFTEDQKGRVWISGPDGWIGFADNKHPERGLVRKFNLRDSIGLTYIHFLATEKNGRIWGLTRDVTFYIDPDSLTFHKLSFDYAGGNIDFFSFQFMHTGEMVIGGRNDIYVFNPATMRRNDEAPKPYIVEVQVRGKPLPSVPTTDGQPSLQLRYWENNFSVAFSAIAHTLGKKCRYRYRLSGQEDWTEAGDRRFVNYTNVPGGKYTFQVQVANSEGVWSPHVLNMPVSVETAWWVTWWFRSALVLAFLGMVYGVSRYRILQIRRQERLKSVFEKRLANVEMSALLAQMNPHFLFNSLNSIDSYIIRNESRKASEYLNNFARLMRLILNNSRSNYISLSDELEALDLYMQMESLRFKDKFEYSIQIDPDLDVQAISIPPMLIQPYIENAIWHGLMHKDEGGGLVTLQVGQEGDSLVCTVEDNGVGRVKAQELTSKRSTRKKSQSMGMKITEDRIEIINKLYDANTRVQVIDLYDDAGNPTGTRVVLTIPI
ncbi:MAG: hypothetical protein EP344_15420 [Bacteroidetes bacterium]|nr:MAG: hypothetical protein EP344_15420 [Bacteroidota bacterium]